jgi:hypothetical protein
MLFHEAMRVVKPWSLKESFQLERAAAKGHEESIWILNLVKGAEMTRGALKEVFAKTEEPLGWHFAGMLSSGRERFDFMKKSAEGGCSWGQLMYSWFFRTGQFGTPVDLTAYIEWSERAASGENPYALYSLGYWWHNVEEGNDQNKAWRCFYTAATLGWITAMDVVAEKRSNGEGCEANVRQAIRWSARGKYSNVFWEILKAESENDLVEDGLRYLLGEGLYWYLYQSNAWYDCRTTQKIFSESCMDYYCSCVHLQQKSIWTFLLCWKQRGLVKEVGVLIGKRVWEERAENLIEKADFTKGF